MLKPSGQKINETRWIRCVCIYTKKRTAGNELWVKIIII